MVFAQTHTFLQSGISLTTGGQQFADMAPIDASVDQQPPALKPARWRRAVVRNTAKPARLISPDGHRKRAMRISPSPVACPSIGTL